MGLVGGWGSQSFWTVISEINGKVGNFAGSKVVKFLALGVLYSVSHMMNPDFTIFYLKEK